MFWTKNIYHSQLQPVRHSRQDSLFHHHKASVWEHRHTIQGNWTALGHKSLCLREKKKRTLPHYLLIEAKIYKNQMHKSEKNKQTQLIFFFS